MLLIIFIILVSSRLILVLLWYNPLAGICWFAHSPSCLDPVVSSSTRSCGHFTGWTKNNSKIANKGWEEETDKHKFRTAKRKKVKLALFRILCVFFMCGYRENSAKIRHSYQECWLIWSSSSLPCTFVLNSIPTSDYSNPTSWALNVWLSAPDRHS